MNFLDFIKENREELLNSLDVRKETFRIAITTMICSEMDKRGICRAQLAEKMGTTRAAVTQLLSGDRNFTIDKLSEVFYYIGTDIQIMQKKENLGTSVINDSKKEILSQSNKCILFDFHEAAKKQKSNKDIQVTLLEEG